MNDKEINDLIKSQAVSPEQGHEIRLHGPADTRGRTRLRNMAVSFAILAGTGMIWMALLALFGTLFAMGAYLAVMLNALMGIAGSVTLWMTQVKKKRIVLSEVSILSAVSFLTVFTMGLLSELYNYNIELNAVIVMICFLGLLLLSMLYQVQRVTIYICIALTLALCFNLPQLVQIDTSGMPIWTFVDLILMIISMNMELQGYMLMVVIGWTLLAEWRTRVQPDGNAFVGVRMVLWFALVAGVLSYYVMGGNMHRLSVENDALVTANLIIIGVGAVLMGLMYWQLSLTEKCAWSLTRLLVCLVPVVLFSLAVVDCNVYVIWALLTAWSLSLMWQAVFFERKSWLIISWLVQTAALWGLPLAEGEYGLLTRGALMLLNGAIMLRLATLANMKREQQLALPFPGEGWLEKNATRMLQREEEIRWLCDHELIKADQQNAVRRSLVSQSIFPTRYFINWMRSVSLSLCTVGIVYMLYSVHESLLGMSTSAITLLVVAVGALLLWAWHQLMKRDMRVLGEMLGALSLVVLLSQPLLIAPELSLGELLDQQGNLYYISAVLLLAIFMTYLYSTRLAATIALVLAFTLLLNPVESDDMAWLILYLGTLFIALIGERAIRSKRYESLSYFSGLGWILWTIFLPVWIMYSECVVGTQLFITAGIAGVILFGLYRTQIMREEGRIFHKSRIALYLAMWTPNLLWTTDLKVWSLMLIAYCMMLHALLSGRNLWFWMASVLMIAGSSIAYVTTDIDSGLGLILLVFVVTVFVAYSRRLRYLDRKQ